MVFSFSSVIFSRSPRSRSLARSGLNRICPGMRRLVALLVILLLWHFLTFDHVQAFRSYAFGCFVDGVVVVLGAEEAPDVAVVFPPGVLPCKARLCGHGPSSSWYYPSVPWAELRPAQEEAMVCWKEAMASLPDALSDQSAHRSVGPGWRGQIAPWAEWRPRQEVECALDSAAQYLLLGLLLAYPRHYRPEAIAEELVALLEVYAVSSP